MGIGIITRKDSDDNGEDTLTSMNMMANLGVSWGCIARTRHRDMMWWWRWWFMVKERSGCRTRPTLVPIDTIF